MTKGLIGKLLLRRSSCLSLGQFPRIKICVGSVSADQCSTDGSTDGTHFSDFLPPFHRSLGWPYFVWALHICAAPETSNCQQYLASFTSSSLDLFSRCTSAQSYATPSNRNTLQIRRFADHAAKLKDRLCWSCEKKTSTGNGLVCPSCRAIQPLDPTVDFFQIFGIERSFKVDLKELEQRYKDLQKILHPDLAGSKSQREQGYSAEQSAHVIQAYYILLRPLSRARYLLELHGIKVEEEGTIDDPELLMEIMEIRESIEEVSDATALKDAQAANNERILDCQKVLESSFRATDLNRAVSHVQRLAYFIKVGEEILRKQ